MAPCTSRRHLSCWPACSRCAPTSTLYLSPTLRCLSRRGRTALEESPSLMFQRWLQGAASPSVLLTWETSGPMPRQSCMRPTERLLRRTAEFYKWTMPSATFPADCSGLASDWRQERTFTLSCSPLKSCGSERSHNPLHLIASTRQYARIRLDGDVAWQAMRVNCVYPRLSNHEHIKSR